MRATSRVAAFALALVATAAAASDYRADVDASAKAFAGAEVTGVMQDIFNGDAERGPADLMSSSTDASEVVDGIYTSPYNGMRVRVPKLGEGKVTVHQAQPYLRDDGTPATTHVLFYAGQAAPIAAIVATRLRDDASRDADTILAKWEPADADQRAALEAQGVRIERRSGPYGPAVERSIAGREFTQRFPYGVSIFRNAEPATLGLARLVVIGDFLYEFSLIVPALPGEADAAHRQRSGELLDLLMGALIRPAPAAP